MKGKRQKTYRKLMLTYRQTFAFRPPYQILLTSDILLDAQRFTMDIVSGLKRTLQDEIKPMITQCCIRHLYASKNEQVITLAKRFERRRCGHHELEEPLSAEECILDVLDPKGQGGNRHKYVVATQERELREKLRRKKGVPLVYIHRSVMILEPMAQESVDVREREEKSKFRSGLVGRTSQAGGLKRKREEEDENAAPMDDGRAKMIEAGKEGNVVEKPAAKKVRKGPKGPNPLSVKKSTKKKAVSNKAQGTKERIPEKSPADAAQGEEVAKKKRKRKHQNGTKAEGETAPEAQVEAT